MNESQISGSITITKNLIDFISKSPEFIIEPEHSLNSINESRFSESFYASGINLLKIRLKSVKKIFSLQDISLNDDVSFITLQLIEPEEIEPIKASNGRIFREINHMKKKNMSYNIKNVHLKLFVKENNIKFKKNKIADLDNLFNKVEKAIENPKTIKIVSQSLDLDHINYENESNIKILPQKLNFVYEKTGEKNNNEELNEEKKIDESENLFLKKIHHKKININNNNDIKQINDEKLINEKKDNNDVKKINDEKLINDEKKDNNNKININDEKIIKEKRDNNEINIKDEKINNKINDESENNKKTINLKDKSELNIDDNKNLNNDNIEENNKNKIYLKDNSELNIDDNKNLNDDNLEENNKKKINLKDDSEFNINKKENIDDKQQFNIENDKKKIINISEIKDKNTEKTINQHEELNLINNKENINEHFDNKNIKTINEEKKFIQKKNNEEIKDDDINNKEIKEIIKNNREEGYNIEKNKDELKNNTIQNKNEINNEIKNETKIIENINKNIENQSDKQNVEKILNKNANQKNKIKNENENEYQIKNNEINNKEKNENNNKINENKQLKSILKKPIEDNIVIKDEKNNSINLPKEHLIDILNQINQNIKKEEKILEINKNNLKIKDLSLILEFLKNFLKTKIKDQEIILFSYKKPNKNPIELLDCFDKDENQILISLNDLLNFHPEEENYNSFIEIENFNDLTKKYIYSPFKNLIKIYLENNNINNNKINENYNKIANQILFQHSNEKIIKYNNNTVNKINFDDLPILIKVLDEENNPHLVREDEIEENEENEELTDIITEETFEPIFKNIILNNPLLHIYPIKDKDNNIVFIPYIYLKYHLNNLQKCILLNDNIIVYDINGDEKVIKKDDFKKLVDLTYIGLCIKTNEDESDFIDVDMINGNKISLPISFLNQLKQNIIEDKALNKRESYYDKKGNLNFINPYKIRPKFLSFSERKFNPYCLKNEDENSYYSIFNLLKKTKDLICKKDILLMIKNSSSQFYEEDEKKYCVEELKISLNPRNDDNIFLPLQLSNNIFIFFKKIFIFKCIDRLTQNKSITSYLTIYNQTINLKENLLNLIQKTPSIFIQDNFLMNKKKTYIDLSIDNKFNFQKSIPSIDNDLFEFIEIKDIHDEKFLIRKPFLRSMLFKPLILNNVNVNDINNKKRIISPYEIINNSNFVNNAILNVPINNRFIQYKNTFIPKKIFNKVIEGNFKDKIIEFINPLTNENIQIKIENFNNSKKDFILVKDYKGKLNFVYESTLLNCLIEAFQEGNETLEIINSKLEKIKININNIYANYKLNDYSFSNNK